MVSLRSEPWMIAIGTEGVRARFAVLAALRGLCRPAFLVALLTWLPPLSFAEKGKNTQGWEACPAWIEPGHQVRLHLDYHAWSGKWAWGPQVSTYRAHAGPGGISLIYGFGNIVIEVARRRCL